MAKIKYSALVSDMRNKLNGSVMSANRYGSYVRNKVTPVNPQSVHQQNARQRFGALSSNFRDLTLAQIKAWNNAAKNFPFTDIFGDTKHLSGQSLFVKLNSNLLKVEQSQIDTPPMPAGFPDLAISDGIFDVDAQGDLSASFKIGDVTVPSGMSLVVYATDGVSKSVQFVKNRFRFLGTFSATANLVDLSTAYTDRFGVPLEDEGVHLKVAYVNNATGQQSVPFSMSVTVTATP